MINVEIAASYARAGLAVLPAHPTQKRPLVGKNQHGKNALFPTEEQVRKQCAHAEAICILCGAVSGNVECIDFDNGGSAFAPWRDRIDPDLFARLVVERSPSGGMHVVYRCVDPIPGSQRLAPDENGKLLIETRGDGSVFLCDPSPRYQLVQGDFTKLPTLTGVERETLLGAARGLGRATPPPAQTNAARAPQKPKAAPIPAPTSLAPVPLPPAPGTTTPYAAKALADEAEKVRTCPEGSRNHTLNTAALKIGHYVAAGEIGEQEVVATLEAAALEAGLHPEEIGMTIRSGLTAGMREPKAGRGGTVHDVDLSILLAKLKRLADEAAARRALEDQAAGIASDTVPAEPLSLADVIPESNGWKVSVMSEYSPRIVRWLWPGRIAQGALSMLVGDAGLGKSFITCDLAARVSTGRPWPDGQPNNGPGRVFMLNDEDDIYTTIRPRLEAAGADCTMIHTKPEEIAGRSVSIIRDLRELEIYALSIPGMRLVIIDPIAAYLGGKDSHNNAEVREALAPLSALAHKHDVAVLVVSHLRKSGGPAKDRVTGSGAFVAAARSVWAVGEDQDNPRDKPRLFVPVKNNLAPDRYGLNYEINPESGYRVEENGEFGDPIPVVRWGKVVDIRADDVLRKPEENTVKPRRRSTSAADEWLTAFMEAGGERMALDVFAAGARAGFSKEQLSRARCRIGVDMKRVGMPSRSVWYVPQNTEIEDDDDDDVFA